MTDLSTSMDERDFGIQVKLDPPDDYPAEYLPDRYVSDGSPASYEQRRREFMDFWANNPAPHNFKASFYELVRLARGRKVHEGILHAAMDYIDARKDCSDFILHSFLRLLYQYPNRKEVSAAAYERSRKIVLSFKYWPDEPGIDSLCTWTENHQILYASAAYLAGQLYPDQVFSNSGQTGRQKMESARPRILRWLDLRFRTGFSEWLSNVYYDEDLAALLSLVDFCEDKAIAQKAATVIDLILYDMALHNFKGVFAASHGRSYENSKKWAAQEATSDTQKLVFGRGIYTGQDNMSAVCLALSPRYLPPEAVVRAVDELDHLPESVNRQRMGIRINQAPLWGLEYDRLEDGMVYLSLEAYTHPRTIDLTMRMFDAYRWWENIYFEPFKKMRDLIYVLRSLHLMPLIAKIFEPDITRNAREEVNLYTYRTPDYCLSSAQDYRPGYGGDQHHIWQATLGPDAVCFTTHPAKLEGHSPNYWVGSGTLPRVAQVKNVLIAVYKIDTRPGLYHTNHLLYTHAWLPEDRFDEIFEQGGWIFARKGDGYLALYSQNGYRWVPEGAGPSRREVIAEGKQNIWICELGRKAVQGSFENFIEQIIKARVVFHVLGVRYQSPSQGDLLFGPKGPLVQDNRPAPLKGYPRYDNPFTQASFPASEIQIDCGSAHLRLDWNSDIREESRE